MGSIWWGGQRDGSGRQSAAGAGRIEPLRGEHARPFVFVRLSGENLIGRICGTNIFVVLRGAVETNRYLLNFGTMPQGCSWKLRLHCEVSLFAALGNVSVHKKFSSFLLRFI